MPTGKKGEQTSHFARPLETNERGKKITEGIAGTKEGESALNTEGGGVKREV